MLNYVTNASYQSREIASCDEEHNFPPAISPTSSTFSSLSSSNYDSLSPCTSSSSKMILNLNHYNNLIVNESNSKRCRRDKQASNKDRVKEEMKRSEFKISLEKHKHPSYDEESEADSGIADSVESPTAKGKKSIWPITTKSKKEQNDTKVYRDVFKKPKTNKEITNLRDIHNTEKFRKPLDYVVKYSKNQERIHANVVLSSATLSEDQRENRYEKKYNSAASLHHKSAAKKYHLKKSVLTQNTNEEEDMDMNASSNDIKLITNKTSNYLKVRKVSNNNNSIHNHQDSPYVLHATIPKNTLSPVRRNLFSCPEESELDHSFSSSLNISSLQRFSSADHARSSRLVGWRNIFKTSSKIKSTNTSLVALEPVSNRLNSSFEHSNSSSNLKLTPLKIDGDTLQRTNGGIFNSLSRIFKRNKRKSESCLKDANNNTLPLKKVHLKNSSQSSLNDLSRVSRSSSESTLNGVNVIFLGNNIQERLEIEAFYTGKESLTSCTITILSSKYSGASSLRQALIDFNRWNSLLFTFSSHLPPTKSLSSEDFLAKRSAFKRSAKTLVINIKNTLINCHSVSFVDCVRLSCCISYADVVSCCSFVLDFVSLPNERKRITDSVTAVGRAFHATVSTSPTYHQVYNKNEVFDDKKSKKLSGNVQKVIENSKNLAFLIDSIRFNQLTLKF